MGSTAGKLSGGEANPTSTDEEVRWFSANEDDVRTNTPPRRPPRGKSKERTIRETKSPVSLRDLNSSDPDVRLRSAETFLGVFTRRKTSPQRVTSIVEEEKRWLSALSCDIISQSDADSVGPPPSTTMEPTPTTGSLETIRRASPALSDLTDRRSATDSDSHASRVTRIPTKDDDVLVEEQPQDGDGNSSICATSSSSGRMVVSEVKKNRAQVSIVGQDGKMVLDDSSSPKTIDESLDQMCRGLMVMTGQQRAARRVASPPIEQMEVDEPRPVETVETTHDNTYEDIEGVFGITRMKSRQDVPPTPPPRRKKSPKVTRRTGFHRVSDPTTCGGQSVVPSAPAATGAAGDPGGITPRKASTSDEEAVYTEIDFTVKSRKAAMRRARQLENSAKADSEDESIYATPKASPMPKRKAMSSNDLSNAYSTPFDAYDNLTSGNVITKPLAHMRWLQRRRPLESPVYEEIHTPPNNYDNVRRPGTPTALEVTEKRTVKVIKRENFRSKSDLESLSQLAESLVRLANNLGTGDTESLFLSHPVLPAPAPPMSHRERPDHKSGSRRPQSTWMRSDARPVSMPEPLMKPRTVQKTRPLKAHLLRPTPSPPIAWQYDESFHEFLEHPIEPAPPPVQPKTQVSEPFFVPKEQFIQDMFRAAETNNEALGADLAGNSESEEEFFSLFLENLHQDLNPQPLAAVTLNGTESSPEEGNSWTYYQDRVVSVRTPEVLNNGKSHNNSKPKPSPPSKNSVCASESGSRLRNEKLNDDDSPPLVSVPSVPSGPRLKGPRSSDNLRRGAAGAGSSIGLSLVEIEKRPSSGGASSSLDLRFHNATRTSSAHASRVGSGSRDGPAASATTVNNINTGSGRCAGNSSCVTSRGTDGGPGVGRAIAKLLSKSEVVVSAGEKESLKQGIEHSDAPNNYYSSHGKPVVVAERLASPPSSLYRYGGGVQSKTSAFRRYFPPISAPYYPNKALCQVNAGSSSFGGDYRQCLSADDAASSSAGFLSPPGRDWEVVVRSWSDGETDRFRGLSGGGGTLKSVKVLRSVLQQQRLLRAKMSSSDSEDKQDFSGLVSFWQGGRQKRDDSSCSQVQVQVEQVPPPVPENREKKSPGRKRPKSFNGSLLVENRSGGHQSGAVMRSPGSPSQRVQIEGMGGMKGTVAVDLIETAMKYFDDGPSPGKRSPASGGSAQKRSKTTVTDDRGTKVTEVSTTTVTTSRDNKPSSSHVTVTKKQVSHYPSTQAKHDQGTSFAAVHQTTVTSDFSVVAPGKLHPPAKVKSGFPALTGKAQQIPSPIKTVTSDFSALPVKNDEELSSPKKTSVRGDSSASPGKVEEIPSPTKATVRSNFFPLPGKVQEFPSVRSDFSALSGKVQELSSPVKTTTVTSDFFASPGRKEKDVDSSSSHSKKNDDGSNSSHLNKVTETRTTTTTHQVIEDSSLPSGESVIATKDMTVIPPSLPSVMTPATNDSDASHVVKRVTEVRQFHYKPSMTASASVVTSGRRKDCDNILNTSTDPWPCSDRVSEVNRLLDHAMQEWEKVRSGGSSPRTSSSDSPVNQKSNRNQDQGQLKLKASGSKASAVQVVSSYVANLESIEGGDAKSDGAQLRVIGLGAKKETPKTDLNVEVGEDSRHRIDKVDPTHGVGDEEAHQLSARESWRTAAAVSSTPSDGSTPPLTSAISEKPKWKKIYPFYVPPSLQTKEEQAETSSQERQVAKNPQGPCSPLHSPRLETIKQSQSAIANSTSNYKANVVVSHTSTIAMPDETNEPTTVVNDATLKTLDEIMAEWGVPNPVTPSSSSSLPREETPSENREVSPIPIIPVDEGGQIIDLPQHDGNYEDRLNEWKRRKQRKLTSQRTNETGRTNDHQQLVFRLSQSAQEPRVTGSVQLSSPTDASDFKQLPRPLKTSSSSSVSTTNTDSKNEPTSPVKKVVWPPKAPSNMWQSKAYETGRSREVLWPPKRSDSADEESSEYALPNTVEAAAIREEKMLRRSASPFRSHASGKENRIPDESQFALPSLASTYETELTAARLVQKFEERKDPETSSSRSRLFGSSSAIPPRSSSLNRVQELRVLVPFTARVSPDEAAPSSPQISKYTFRPIEPAEPGVVNREESSRRFRRSLSPAVTSPVSPVRRSSLLNNRIDLDVAPASSVFVENQAYIPPSSTAASSVMEVSRVFQGIRTRHDSFGDPGQTPQHASSSGKQFEATSFRAPVHDRPAPRGVRDMRTEASASVNVLLQHRATQTRYRHKGATVGGGGGGGAVVGTESSSSDSDEAYPPRRRPPPRNRRRKSKHSNRAATNDRQFSRSVAGVNGVPEFIVGRCEVIQSVIPSCIMGEVLHRNSDPLGLSKPVGTPPSSLLGKKDLDFNNSFDSGFNNGGNRSDSSSVDEEQTPRVSALIESFDKMSSADSERLSRRVWTRNSTYFGSSKQSKLTIAQSALGGSKELSKHLSTSAVTLGKDSSKGDRTKKDVQEIKTSLEAKSMEVIGASMTRRKSWSKEQFEKTLAELQRKDKVKISSSTSKSTSSSPAPMTRSSSSTWSKEEFDTKVSAFFEPAAPLQQSSSSSGLGSSTCSSPTKESRSSSLSRDESSREVTPEVLMSRFDFGPPAARRSLPATKRKRIRPKSLPIPEESDEAAMLQEYMNELSRRRSKRKEKETSASASTPPTTAAPTPDSHPEAAVSSGDKQRVESRPPMKDETESKGQDETSVPAKPSKITPEVKEDKKEAEPNSKRTVGQEVKLETSSCYVTVKNRDPVKQPKKQKRVVSTLEVEIVHRPEDDPVETPAPSVVKETPVKRTAESSKESRKSTNSAPRTKSPSAKASGGGSTLKGKMATIQRDRQFSAQVYLYTRCLSDLIFLIELLDADWLLLFRREGRSREGQLFSFYSRFIFNKGTPSHYVFLEASPSPL
ncbi:unnamed protein product [Cyprideis torosa]|uniref:Uncharacterized protein n=1 Tax=Cyprideis torosa TaxID=163714 RepID=A0A7R8W580_9CRUS|nr:unnamed protein product [Cyprideis torosa]CAG0883986.1 unnamed protein product [Cyprideis torosa]